MLRFLGQFQADFQLKSGWIEPLLVGGYAPFSPLTFSNSFGDLRKNIEYLIGMERQSGRMDEITPLYVSRMLNVPLEEVEEVMKEL